MSVTNIITRIDLERMSVKQPENKENTISRIVNDFKYCIIHANAKGEKSTELLITDNRPEIESKVIEKLKEIFVDVDITIRTVGLCKMLCFNWEIAPSEKVTTEAYEESDPESDIIKKIAKNIVKKVTMEVADESDDESDEESDDDPLEINLHIVVSNSRMEMVQVCMMVYIVVISLVMSVVALRSQSKVPTLI